MIKLKRVQKRTVCQDIIDQIRNAVLSEELKPGEKLPSERAMAEMMGVSRSSVREAIRALQYIGVLDIRINDGAYLNDRKELLSDQIRTSFMLKKFTGLELNEARQTLEIEIVRLAIERLTEDSRKYLIEAFEKAVNADEAIEDYLEPDFEFHEALADAAQNPILLAMLSSVKDLVLQTNIEVMKRPHQRERSISFHRKILDSVLSGDVSGAQEAMRDHFRMITETLDKVSEMELEKSLKDISFRRETS